MSSKDNSGALFRNDKKESDNHPDYTGKASIQGVEYWLSAWVNTFNKDGTSRKYFSLSFKKKDAAPPQSKQPETDLDDDIPF